MNTMTISNSIRSMYRLFAAIVLIAMCVPVTFAGEVEEHNPYTIYGMRLRSHLIPETPGATDELGPLVFQEIVPCRFVSTLEEDKYDNPWGGKEYQIQETRTYYPKGVLVSSNNWENPCSLHVPIDAVAVSLRLTSIEPEQGTNIYLAPATYSTHAQKGMWFAGGRNEMKEANVVLKNDGFSMTTDNVSHLTIDVIGFFLRDPMGYGAKGDKGDKGDQGERGESGAHGLSGEKGEKGENGTAGAQGLQGERGERGEAGAQGVNGEKGEKGERGEAGAQGFSGAKGEKGDNGTAGAQGLEGDKGERGEAGAQGFKGDKGEKGDNGTAGAQGFKGDNGDRGDRGSQGERGTTGATGAQGPAGARGATGPQGVKGDKGDANVGFVASAGGPYTFPPGGNITIYDSDVTANSFIVLTYVEVSNGNALGIASQSKGSFVATGSPNKPFKYLVVTMK